MNNRSLSSLVLTLALASQGSSCATRANYVHPLGPRYAGDHTPEQDTPREQRESFAPLAPDTLRVVSYNVRYGKQIEAALELLTQTPELASADVFLLQEMSRVGVDRLARALDCRYVYYPASHRKSGLDFGNAVLTRGRFLDDEKVLLPGTNPFNRQRRIAVRTGIEIDGRALQVYSVHTETPFLGLKSRSEQIDCVLTSVPDAPGPCLIAGDLNTMSARSLRRFEDAFEREGFQRVSGDIGKTFGVGPFHFTTDHVFVRELEPLRSGKAEGGCSSDHDPIWVEMAWSSLPTSTAPPVIAAGPALETRTHPLARFPEQRTPIGEWMKRNGWKSKRHSPKHFELAGGRLHLVSDDDSVLIGTDKGMPGNPQAWPRLRLRLKVDRVPEGTDLTRKRGDDAAFRIYVAFDRGGGWLSPPDTIAYTWTENLEPGTLVQSAHYKRVKYLSIGQGVTTGQDDDGWVTIECNLLEDYKRLFPDAKEIPDLAGFMLKCDTNNTGSVASAWLEGLELVSAD